MPLVTAQLGRGTVLADGRTHRLRVRYLERGAQLEVYLDEMSDPLLVAHGLMLHEVLARPRPFNSNPNPGPNPTPGHDPDPNPNPNEVLDAEGKAFVGFTAASDGDGAVHELLDWRLGALESATLGRAAPQQLAAGTDHIMSTVSVNGGSE